MSDVAIRVENLGKRYRLGLTHKGTIREAFDGLINKLLRRREARNEKLAASHSPLASSPQTSDGGSNGKEFWALKDVSFEVRRGEVLGIIGRNGAGKSTLLKILSQVTKPTTGRAEICGRVGSLLEVGTGFHPELTGRENVYLNGAILGMTKREIDRKFDEIVDFAGVEKFIDTPVKRYSSGMHVRLGFAVAAHLEPEIMMVDEVLAVGDAAFQKKCLGKLDDVAGQGRTILFVSHNMGVMRRLCRKCVLLVEGRVSEIGESVNVIENYVAPEQVDSTGVFIFEDGDGKGIEFFRLEFLDSDGKPTTTFGFSDRIRFRITYRVTDCVSAAAVNAAITDPSLGVIWSFCDLDFLPKLYEARERGTYVIDCEAPPGVLRPGTYSLELSAGTLQRRFHAPSKSPRFDISMSGFDKPSYGFFGGNGSPIAVPMEVKMVPSE